MPKSCHSRVPTENGRTSVSLYLEKEEYLWLRSLAAKNNISLNKAARVVLVDKIDKDPDFNPTIRQKIIVS